MFVTARFDGVVSLRWPVNTPNVFVGTMTERLLTYGSAVARAPDMPVVRRIVRESARQLSFLTLITEIVTSTPFDMKMKTGTY